MMDETDQYYYKGTAGIKTGNLESYGRNIITMATKGDISYLLILMKAPFDDEDGELQYYHMEDATNLLDWAFKDFSYVTSSRMMKNWQKFRSKVRQEMTMCLYVRIRLYHAVVYRCGHLCHSEKHQPTGKRPRSD